MKPYSFATNKEMRKKLRKTLNETNLLLYIRKGKYREKYGLIDTVYDPVDLDNGYDLIYLVFDTEENMNLFILKCL